MRRKCPGSDLITVKVYVTLTHVMTMQNMAETASISCKGELNDLLTEQTLTYISIKFSDYFKAMV